MDYQKIYNDLINKARTEGRSKGGEIYYEAHHIIPKCLGGDGKCRDWKTHPNIILLTAKEHFLAHYYLTKIYPNNPKLIYAFWTMCNMKSNGKRPDRDYSNIEDISAMYVEVKTKLAEDVRRRMIGHCGTEKRNKKIADALRGRRTPQEVRDKIADKKRGVKQSNETISKRVAANKKRVEQLTKDGLFLREWPSQAEAAEGVGIARQTIGECLRGRSKSAGGFLWKYSQG